MTINKKYIIDYSKLDKGFGVGKIVEQAVRMSTDPRDFEFVKESIPCQDQCPAKTNIPAYIRTLYEGRYGRSYEINRFVNIFPGILGRICSRPCEKSCRHGWAGLGEPVSICSIKRAAADFKGTGHRIGENLFSASGKKVAIIGAGPAGLTAAHDLAKLGHSIDVYESKSTPGGMLKYGIPRFRLPQDVIDMDFSYVFRLGITVLYDKTVGVDIHMDELLDAYDAVIVSGGCSISNKLNLPGEDLRGVYPALEFMENYNNGKTIETGSNCFVIGGGFTAMDCVRSAVRLGSKSVSLNILSTEKYLTIPKEELFHIKEERIQIHSLVDVQEFIGKNGKLTAVRFKKSRIETISSDGQAITRPIPGSDFTVDADSVIVAIGQQRDHSIAGFKLRTDPRGKALLSKSGSYVDNEKLFFCGDFYTGPSTVIDSIGHSRSVCRDIDKYLSRRVRKQWMVLITPHAQSDRSREWDFIDRQEMPLLPPNQRTEEKFIEVEKGFTRETAHTESRRCYLCYLNYEIRVDECIYCFACIDVAPRNCIKKVREILQDKNGKYTFVETDRWNDVNAIVIDNKECIRCSACYNVCPVKCIQVSKTELIDTDMER